VARGSLPYQPAIGLGRQVRKGPQLETSKDWAGLALCTMIAAVPLSWPAFTQMPDGRAAPDRPGLGSLKPVAGPLACGRSRASSTSDLFAAQAAHWAIPSPAFTHERVGSFVYSSITSVPSIEGGRRCARKRHAKAKPVCGSCRSTGSSCLHAGISNR
jgi:hypothetical protein